MVLVSAPLVPVGACCPCVLARFSCSDLWVPPTRNSICHGGLTTEARFHSSPSATQRGLGGMSLCSACPAGVTQLSSLSPGGHPHHDPATIRRVGVL